MSDREPRRRKKRKDSAKKDDMRSDNIFTPVQTETMDSDQEVEEEVVITIHQPSTFAKIVFVVLFSGLILSMSFIFISLHGAERGAVDLFDDHHIEEQQHVESLEQNHNESLSVDHPEESEHPDEDAEHEETESWSSSEFFSENLMNMLPEIGNIFSSEKVEESQDEVNKQNSLSGLRNEESEKEISEDILQKSSMDSENDENSNSQDQGTENNDDFIVHSDYSDEVVLEQPDTNDNFEQLLEEKVLESVYTEQVTEPTPDTTDYYRTQVPDYEDDNMDMPYEQNVEDILSSTSFPDVYSEQVASQEQEYASEFPFSNNYDEQTEETTTENIATAPDYEEEDKLSYEKASITNEKDYSIREELDEMESLMDENLSEETYNVVSEDDDNDDDEEEEEENDNENEDEFDFWQF